MSFQSHRPTSVVGLGPRGLVGGCQLRLDSWPTIELTWLPGHSDRFWPHKDAQRCCLLRISEYRFGRSAAEWAGSGCARHISTDQMITTDPVVSASVPVACPMERSETVCSGHSRTRQIAAELQRLWSGKHDKPVPKLIVRCQGGLDSVLLAPAVPTAARYAIYARYGCPGQAIRTHARLDRSTVSRDAPVGCI